MNTPPFTCYKPEYGPDGRGPRWNQDVLWGVPKEKPAAQFSCPFGHTDMFAVYYTEPNKKLVLLCEHRRCAGRRQANIDVKVRPLRGSCSRRGPYAQEA